MRRKLCRVFSIVLQGVLITALPSCHKEEAAIHHVPIELKELFSYDIGSYWVFYDSVSSSLDSIYVINKAVGVAQGSDDESIKITLIDTNLESRVPTSIWNIGVFASGASDIKVNLISNSIKHWDIGAIVFSGRITYGMPLKAEKHVDNMGNTYESRLLPAYSDGINNYNDVYRIHNVDSNSYSIQCINKNCGFINLVDSNTYMNRKMRLLRYNIIRK